MALVVQVYFFRQRDNRFPFISFVQNHHLHASKCAHLSTSLSPLDGGDDENRVVEMLLKTAEMLCASQPPLFYLRNVLTDALRHLMSHLLSLHFLASNARIFFLPLCAFVTIIELRSAER